MSLCPPDYWTAFDQSVKPWTVVTVSAAEIDALRIGMVPGGTFGGKDHKTSLNYKGIVPVVSWRLQHPGLWGKYAMEREKIRELDLKALALNGLSIPRVDVRNEYVQMMDKLPAKLDHEINEVYLSHGMKPESLLAILSGGLNERFSGGLFGNGTYLAEDVAKNDQYCTIDQRHGAHPDLHQLLYDGAGVVHPGNVLYVIFCRVVLGSRIRTQDGIKDMDSSPAAVPLGGRRSIWSSERRELATIQSSNPPIIHHSLLAETGGKIARFREFVVYHGDRIYPEYIVAYQRQ